MNGDVSLEWITGSLIVLGNILTGLMSFLMVRLNRQAKDASTKVEAVKAALEKTTNDTTGKLIVIAKTGEKIHILVNSNMSVQLKLNANLSRRMANLTKDPDDIRAADLAQQLFVEHEAKQSKVDQKG